jgi:hypothetical protein
VKLKVRIEAVRHGSFELYQLIEIAAASGLFQSPNLEHILEVFDIIKQYIDIKKFLGGSRADKIEEGKNSITINFNGNNIQVAPNAFKIYQNSYTVNDSVMKIGSVLDEDEDVDGLQLTDAKQQKSLLQIPREEFVELTSPNAYLSEDTREELVDATLTITKPELNPKTKSKWNFIYKGRKISGVTISDIDFLREVREGLRFGNGDALKTDMKIVYQFDPIYNVFIEKRFEVLLVKDVIFVNQQRSIGDA